MSFMRTQFGKSSGSTNETPEPTPRKSQRLRSGRGSNAPAAHVAVRHAGGLLSRSGSVCSGRAFFLGRREPESVRQPASRRDLARDGAAVSLDEILAGEFRATDPRARGRRSAAGLDGPPLPAHDRGPKFSPAARSSAVGNFRRDFFRGGSF